MYLSNIMAADFLLGRDLWARRILQKLKSVSSHWNVEVVRGTEEEILSVSSF
jgi:hypothetical protein